MEIHCQSLQASILGFERQADVATDKVSALHERLRLADTHHRDLQAELARSSAETRDAHARCVRQEEQSGTELLVLQTQYETRLRGLLPERLRHELEATIAALKEQVCAPCPLRYD